MDIYADHLHNLLHKELCLAIRIGAAPCWVVLVYRKVFRLSIPLKLLSFHNYEEKDNEKVDMAMTAYTVAEDEKTIFFTPNSTIACQCQNLSLVVQFLANHIDITSRRFALPVTLFA